MNDLQISMVFDLQGRTARRATGIRDLVEKKLNDPAAASYGLDCGDMHVRRVLGSLVKISPSRGNSIEETLRLFDGLSARVVEIRESGTDHFPSAGCYDSGNVTGCNIKGASATVRWSLDHRYPLSEDVIETAVRRASEESSFTDTLRLEVPVVFARSWSLTLTAPNPAKARLAYELLRSGEWRPMYPFADQLPDPQKLRLLRQSIEEG